MDFIAAKLVSVWILPPAVFIVLVALALFLLRRNLRLARWTLGACLALLVLLSLPIVSGGLMTTVETYPALSEQDLREPRAAAIVILSAGRKTLAPEYGRDAVDRLTLERLRYGAYLHRQTGLPILVTGGAPLTDRVALGHLMEESLRTDFGVPTEWVENQSRNTAENAEFSARILKKNDIQAVYLVTHAWHMRRAKPVFERAGLRVIAAPTAFEGYRGEGVELGDFVPSIDAMVDSYFALHEIVGHIWYVIRY